MPIFNGENDISDRGGTEPGSAIPLPASIAEVLRPALAARPEAPAIEAASGIWNYRELDERADTAAAALWSFGVRPGDRVAACLPNDLDIVAAFHGAQRIGAIWAGIGEAMAAAEQQHLHDLIEPKVVLAGPRCLLDVAARVDATRWAAAQDAPAAPPVETALDNPAGIAFTSGTSGRPKAVVHSQRTLLLPGAVLVATREWGPSLRKGDSFPLTILNMIVLSTLLTAQAGGCAVIMDRRDVTGVAEWITTRKVTVWNGAPAQLHDLAACPELDLSSLREVWSGGSDTPDRLRVAFAAAHGLVPRSTYGLTEAPTVVSIDPPGSDWTPRTSGTVLPHYDVAAYDDHGNRLAPGEIGELRLSGRTDGPWANLWRPLLGHWAGGGIEPPPAGPVATGDIGTVDSAGRLTLLDRKKMVIIRGSANIYPLEVERVLDAHPAVVRSAVCAIPHERLGQQVAAVIQTNGAAVDFTELAEHCRRELAGYKVPEVWAAVDTLPTNAMGKVVRTQLPELLSHVVESTQLLDGHRSNGPSREAAGRGRSYAPTREGHTAPVPSAHTRTNVRTATLRSFELDGRVALVTGASSGLGTAVSRALAGLGARVAVVARRRDRLDSLAGEIGGFAVSGDLSDPAAIAAIVPAVAAQLGPPEILVNAAGNRFGTGRAEAEPLDDIRRTLDLNLVAPLLLAQQVFPYMRDVGRGSIVNISSISGQVGVPGIPQASYAASKAGLSGLTAELAVQWARYSIRVNTVAPGFFRSEITDSLYDSERGAEYLRRNIPLPTEGTAEDMVGAVVWLAGEASRYVTGQTIVVDGGWTAR